MSHEINPFDILSGKVYINNHGDIYYFKESGNNMKEDNWPIWENLHREDGPAVIYKLGLSQWFINGMMIGEKYKDNPYVDLYINKH